MKHERMTFSLCLAAVIVASVVSFASIMCLVETFDINCSPRHLMIVCCLVAGAAVLFLSLKHSWIYGCTALAIYLFLLISSRYPAVITPDGSAIIVTPKTEETIVTSFPIAVIG